ncbi:uncharacterized protein LOC141606437 isoform X1 [Silene latifolia]|uniref:uncharacterized protein LOC141606437 isoform X1 n=2 Tax=Silene latifolia TaxID=37657 RepID=UPI003D76EDBC
MVVKMMRWRPWPPQLTTKKYEVKLLLRRLEGWPPSDDGDLDPKLTVEIRWKGPPKLHLIRRRSVQRHSTKQVVVDQLNGAVFNWDQEFSSICSFTSNINDKDNQVSFHPWEISFSLLHDSKTGGKNKVSVIAFASLNLAEYASMTEQKEFDVAVPLTVPGHASDPCPCLHISLSLLEVRTAQDSGDSLHRSIVPLSSSPPQSGDTLPAEKDELSALKAGLRKVKILTEYVSTRRTKKACREEESSEDGDYPFDSDSFEEFGEGEIDEGKEEASVRKSFSYGTLAYANYFGGSFFSSMRVSSQDEDWIYYSQQKSDVECSVREDATGSVSESPLMQTTKRSILPWRKRKLNFRSPKAKGEPLLKKAYAEEGGDDIDFDRRQLSSDESVSLGCLKSDEDSAANRLSVSEFGDDYFAVGSWDQKEIVSRDGHMKLYAEVFFASIDQMSERAAGESACTALVAVIADWFHNNCGTMPIKSQFDSLIREGSLEWRRLCMNETYRERFPDKHFDLETVLQAKIRPLSVDTGKSFIGFFHPEEAEEGKFDFLHGAMSFDGIWVEITRVGLDNSSVSEPYVYVVSWNDHFFILKVELDAYYIIDTLGERLYEGCNQAYILKFDRNTKIVKLQDSLPSSDDKPVLDQSTEGAEPGPTNGAVLSTADEPTKHEEEEVVCQGKEACKDYIKNFLAALPLRELLVDLKKGLVTSPPLHRLQIELHYTQIQPPLAVEPVNLTTNVAHEMEVAITECH